MTIDEALYNIKQGYGIPHKHDTLTTIIEYVKQTEPCEDVISRRDSIASIKALYPDMPIVDILDSRKRWAERHSQYIDCEKVLAQLPPFSRKLCR